MTIISNLFGVPVLNELSSTLLSLLINRGTPSLPAALVVYGSEQLPDTARLPRCRDTPSVHQGWRLR